jgi:cytochrome P450
MATPSGHAPAPPAAARTGSGVRQVTMPSGLRAWLVTGYPEARAALADPRLAKDAGQLAGLMQRQARLGDDASFSDYLSKHMLNSDPPYHERLRGLVNKAFTARRVEHLRRRVQEICDGLIAALAARREADLIESLAIPLPITVICELLGVPEPDRDSFRALSNTLVAALPAPVVAEASRAMGGYLRGLVASKRAEPGEDMLSALIGAREAADRLTDDEVISMAVLLLAAGHETTVNLIGNGMLALVTNPGQFAALRADRTLLPNAIEEFLRYDGPVSHATMRFTERATVIGGAEIPPGELVMVSLDAADHDPQRFPDPDRLDLRRPTGGHLAFGHGIHYCLGAPLARLEAEIAFTGLLDRFSLIELAIPVDTLRWRVSTVMRGLERLPLRLTVKTSGEQRQGS